MVDILYSDNHLLLINKPAGVLTQSNHLGEISLEEMAKKWVKENFNKPGSVFLQAVHRLDKGVSGVVLFARTSKALTRLNEQMREQHFEKKYLAIVEGHIKKTEALLEHDLIHGNYQAYADPGGKKCQLRYRVLKKIDGHTLVEIALLTGRYHQIRAQLSLIGHPVLGDRKYGSICTSKCLFLHHLSLNFSHPITQQQILCTTPVPRYWDARFNTSFA